MLAGEAGSGEQPESCVKLRNFLDPGHVKGISEGTWLAVLSVVERRTVRLATSPARQDAEDPNLSARTDRSGRPDRCRVPNPPEIQRTRARCRWKLRLRNPVAGRIRFAPPSLFCTPRTSALTSDQMGILHRRLLPVLHYRLGPIQLAASRNRAANCSSS
jgi:hypothetical protein